uniref:Putative membrane protein n=1 Tax=Lutzomyia longipalpis TaxID=7200 RepID=A0A7G3AKC1_LUTLO
MVLCVGEEVDDFYDAIYPYYLVSKILGFAAFPLRIQRTKILFWKHFILNFSLHCLSRQCLCSYITDEKVYTGFKDTSVTGKTRPIIMSIIPLNYFFMIAMNFVLQTPIQNLLAKIARCDQLMWKIGIQIDYRYHYRSIIAYLIATAFHTLMLILFMTFFLLEYNFPTISLKGVVIYLSATFAYTTFTGQMLLTLVAIKVRFRLINKHFEKHFLNRKNSVEEISDTSGLICKISTAHDHLNDIVCQTNICYSFQVSFDYSQSREELLMILWYFQILMMMLAWIVYTIHGIYDFYRIVFLYRANNQIFGYIGIIWISYYTTYLSGIVVMSSLVKREGMKTAILVHQAINLQRNQKNIEKAVLLFFFLHKLNFIRELNPFPTSSDIFSIARPKKNPKYRLMNKRTLISRIKVSVIYINYAKAQCQFTLHYNST